MTKQMTLVARMKALAKLFSDRRKWTKAAMKDRKANHTCYCMAGGLNKVAGRDVETTALPEDELKALDFRHEDQVFSWNDASVRTIKEVQHRVAFGLKNARRMARGLEPLSYNN